MRLQWIDTKNFAAGVITVLFLLIGVFHGQQVSGQSPPPVQQNVGAQVNLTICGDSIISPPEICDDGMDNGVYSSTIVDRNCNSTDCQGFAPYCGDFIVQPIHGEECDDGDNLDDATCTADCQLVNPPPPIGGGGGGGGGLGPFNPGSPTELVDTAVRIVGKAYPNTSVNILQNGVVTGVVPASAGADFLFETEEVTPGITTFGIWAEDVNGLQSLSITLTFRVAPNAVTTVGGAYLPPTIGLEDNVVSQGDPLPVFGQTVPQANVFVQKNQDAQNLTQAASDQFGNWTAEVDTSNLTNQAFHTAGAYFQIPGGGQVLRSSLGRFVSFFVGEGEGDQDNCGRSDINDDNRVNLVDFSILLFNWGTNNANSDINLDGTVNLTDFSIMLFCWTG
jgi:hypothetical protein